MKKQLLVILFSLSFITYASIEAVNDANGKNGYVGGPGEPSCSSSGCHNDHAANFGSGSVTISSSNMSNMQYTPGQTYHMSVTVSESGKGLFGFGFEALDSANNNVGTIVVTKSSETNLHNSSYLGSTYPAGRMNIGHVKNAGAVSNSKTFTFDWKPPYNYCGNIYFYAVGNATNNDGQASGDNVYTTTATATPAATGRVSVVCNTWPFAAYVGGKSAPQIMYVSGEYLSSNLTVSAPSDYEVSLASGSGYASSVSLAPTANALRFTPVYVRLSPSSTGTANGNITLSGAGSGAFGLTGTAYTAGSPMLSYTGRVVTHTIQVGGTSAAQLITVDGSNLTANATLSVAAPFQISSTQSGGYSTSMNLTPSSGSIASAKVYIKYVPTTAGTQTGSLTISSTGATTKTISLQGISIASSTAALYIQPNFDPFVSSGVGTPSAAQSFQLDAVMPVFTATIAAPTHFEISTNASSGYSNKLTLTPVSKLISGQIIYIRYKPLFAGTEYEDFNIASPVFATKFLSVVGYIAKAQGSLNVNINGKDSICKGDSSVLTASGATTYTWQPGNLTGGSITVLPTQTTNYTVTGTTGSQTAQAQFTVNVVPPTKAGFSNAAFDSAVTFTNASSNATTYAWDFGDGQKSTLAAPQHIYTTTGTYKALLTVTGFCGTDTLSQYITIHAYTGIRSPFASSFEVFPNPVADECTLLIGDANSRIFTVRVVNAIGQVVYTKTMASAATKLDLANVHSGIYMIQVWDKDVLLGERKIVKQ